MKPPSSSIRDLARRLLAECQSASGGRVPAAVVVSERLRISLTRFAGADGFAALLRRALMLASAEVPSLQIVKIGADGRLEGLEQLAAETGPGAGVGEPAVTITAHLLCLLVTFIGEPLTQTLVREAWADTSPEESISIRETGS